MTMSEELQAVLEGYLNKYPHTLAQVRRSRKSSTPNTTKEAAIDLTEEELRDSFATGPGKATKFCIIF